MLIVFAWMIKVMNVFNFQSIASPMGTSTLLWAINECVPIRHHM